LQLNPEALLNRVHNPLGKMKDVFSPGASVIDQDQRLSVMDATVSFPKPFPSCLLNEPGCRYLGLSLPQGIDGQIGVLLAEGFGPAPLDDRVFEETAGVADPGRVRQLAAADMADHSGDVVDIGMQNAFGLQGLVQRGIGAVDPGVFA